MHKCAPARGRGSDFGDTLYTFYAVGWLVRVVPLFFVFIIHQTYLKHLKKKNGCKCTLRHFPISHQLNATWVPEHIFEPAEKCATLWC